MLTRQLIFKLEVSVVCQYGSWEKLFENSWIHLKKYFINRKFGPSYLGMATAATRAALPKSYKYMLGLFVSLDCNWVRQKLYHTFSLTIIIITRFIVRLGVGVGGLSREGGGGNKYKRQIQKQCIVRQKCFVCMEHIRLTSRMKFFVNWKR